MACAAVTHLLETLEQMLHTPTSALQIQREQIESLHKKFTFFEDFLTASEDKFIGDEIVRHLEWAIRDLACRVEDYFEEILFNHSVWIEELESENCISCIHDKAQEMFKDIDFIEAKILKLYAEVCGIIPLPEENYPVQRLPLQDLDSEDSLVFSDETILTILERLAGHPSKLQIIAIVGMESVGKTTLAKGIFEYPFLVHHFHIRAWITVANGFTVRETLLGLLQCIARITSEVYEKSNGELSEHLFRTLKGHRFLIVIDNILSNEDWNYVKRSFPDDKNGSRVLLTSRLMSLASHVNNSRPTSDMHFPYVEESWKHVCEVAVPEDQKPLVEVVKIGNKLAEDYQGLLLAILVAAGILSKLSDTPNYWRNVVERAGSFTSEFFMQRMDILTLNFNHFPRYLRACFFCVQVLPDEYEIFFYVVIRVWIFLGLLRPDKLKSLEEVGKACLEDMVNEELRWNNSRVKTNFIHDFFWDLSCQDSQRDKFLDLVRKSLRFVSKYMDEYPHLSFTSDIHLHAWVRPPFPLTRSFLWFGMEKYFLRFPCHFPRLMRGATGTSFSREFTTLDYFPSLTNLHLTNGSLEIIPSSLSSLPSLEALFLDNCAELEFLSPLV